MVEPGGSWQVFPYTNDALPQDSLSITAAPGAQPLKNDYMENFIKKNEHMIRRVCLQDIMWYAAYDFGDAVTGRKMRGSRDILPILDAKHIVYKLHSFDAHPSHGELTFF